jgi:hypothetical protein
MPWSLTDFSAAGIPMRLLESSRSNLLETTAKILNTRQSTILILLGGLPFFLNLVAHLQFCSSGRIAVVARVVVRSLVFWKCSVILGGAEPLVNNLN